MQDFTLYFQLGIEHILTPDAMDHILFVAALCHTLSVAGLEKVINTGYRVHYWSFGNLALSALGIVQFPSA